jgi:hypothetical protein
MGMDSGTGKSVTILRNGVSMRATRLGTRLYSFAMLPSIIAMGAAFGKHPGAPAARLWSAGETPALAVH